MKSEHLDKRIQKAVKIFWTTRSNQDKRQGATTGKRDTGKRTAVTGGKHLNGFVNLCREIVTEAGIPEANVYWRGKKTVPGFFRAEKDWDIVVSTTNQLIAIIEFKAQVGSFGNNCNNRMEEAIGSASDLWASYREGVLKPSIRPWLGYVFLLEDCEKSRKPVRVTQSHFAVLPEFVGASYSIRYEIFLEKLLRERLYDGASLILTPEKGGASGAYSCPSAELDFHRFAAGLSAHVSAHKDLI